MGRHKFIAISLVGFIAFTTGGWLQRPGSQDQITATNARIFREVISHVVQYYVDSLAEADLYDMAIDGMLKRLGDPYTNFLGPEHYRALSLSTTGNYAGIGISIESRDSWVTVVTTFPDTPGERVGLLPGDQIAEIEEVSIRNWSTTRASQRLKGPPGTEVNIKVRRTGMENLLSFSIVRERIHINSVEGAMMIRPGIGYMRLLTVSDVSAGETAQALAHLSSLGMRSLILDLRGNTGGILNQGVGLADLFLDSGEVVVETRGRARGASQIYRTQRPQLWSDMKLIVLVNGFTASAAEILSGALQDHDRALLLGTPTFGKGVAYLVFPLSDSQAISVTSSRWYTPVGRSIDRPERAALATAVAQATVDSADTGPETIFHSFGGRPLEGGDGGIQPDIILPDTLSDGEQRFVAALGASVSDYRSATSQYARQLQTENRVSEPDFEVTQQMLGELLELVRDRGVDISDSLWYGARELVSQQLGWDLTRFQFGRAAELRRRASDDIQVLRAVELLQEALTTEDLLARTTSN